jgi:hypothetical protein
MTPCSWARQGADVGYWMPGQAGTPLLQAVFDRVFDMTALLAGRQLRTGSQEADQEIARQLASKLVVQDRAGHYFAFGGYQLANVDLTNPRLQRDLADIQLLDAIVGQTDRHGENLLVRTGSGAVRAVDHDRAFHWGGAGDDPGRRCRHYPGLPPLVTDRAALRVLSFDVTYLDAVLTRPTDPIRLPAADVRSAQRRLRLVQAHLQRLVSAQRTVSRWSALTFDQQVRAARPGDQAGRGIEEITSYLAEQVSLRRTAMARSTRRFIEHGHEYRLSPSIERPAWL